MCMLYCEIYENVKKISMAGALCPPLNEKKEENLIGLSRHREVRRWAPRNRPYGHGQRTSPQIFVLLNASLCGRSRRMPASSMRMMKSTEVR